MQRSANGDVAAVHVLPPSVSARAERANNSSPEPGQNRVGQIDDGQLSPGLKQCIPLIRSTDADVRSIHGGTELIC